MKRAILGETEPNAIQSVLPMETFVRGSSLPVKIRELIKIRASEINGCAYCIDMHTRDALKEGESQRRIFAISAWKESPLFTEEERAVLQMTEEVTEISKNGVSDDTYEKVIKYFGEHGYAYILMQICAINVWNRIAISSHQVFEPKE